MTFPSSGTVPHGCARYLERAADVACLRELLRQDSHGDRERRSAVRWAEHEQAIEIAVSPDARKLAGRLAAAGDVQAAEALADADSLDDAVVADQRELRRGVHATGSHAELSKLGYNGSQLGAHADPGQLTRFREELAEHRAAGVPFAEAWSTAIAGLPHGKYQRWPAALAATIESWRSCYEGAPAGRGDEAVSRLQGLAAGEWSEVVRELAITS